MRLPRQLVIMDNVSVPRHVTRLRWRPMNTAAPDGRQLASVPGAEVRGNLNVLGYFSAELCIGTPQRRFDMIVDTGSTHAVLPCADCTRCGQHRYSNDSETRYNEDASSTSQAVPCTQPPPGMKRCDTCERNRCGYQISYYEGSVAKGRLVRDVVWFGATTGGSQHVHVRRPVQTSFGCQTRETGMIFDQVADGIVGLAPSDVPSATLFDYLQRETGCPDVFSLCLGDDVGAMVLGGQIRRRLEKSLQWIKYDPGDSSFKVDLLDISFMGERLNIRRALYRDTIVDSGTGFTYVPPEAYRVLSDRFRTRCPWGSCQERVVRGRGKSDICYMLDDAEVGQMGVMTLHFANGVALDLSPRQYTHEDTAGVHCFTLRDNDTPGVALGSSVMRGHEVIFDRANRRLAFVKADCTAAYMGDLDGALEGGFSLNGCASPDPIVSIRAGE